MISLLFSGLIVAILAGRGVEPAEITEEPVSQENPDAATADPSPASLPPGDTDDTETDYYDSAYNSFSAATADPSPASLPPGDTDDTETDYYDSAVDSFSGHGEEVENGSLSDTGSNTNHNGGADAARNEGTSTDVLVISIVLVILVLVISVCIVILYRRRREQKAIPSDVKEGVALAVCDPETPPTPLFEDDIPSVLELEVEDLQKLPEKTKTVESTSDSEEDS